MLAFLYENADFLDEAAAPAELVSEVCLNRISLLAGPSSAASTLPSVFQDYPFLPPPDAIVPLFSHASEVSRVN